MSIFNTKVIRVLLVLMVLTNSPLNLDKSNSLSAQENEQKDSSKEPSETDSNVVDTSSVRKKETTIGPQFVRFHLWDGSIIGGDVQAPSVQVDTDFGPLVVPIHRIVRFYPGTQSIPNLKSEIETLVQALGDKAYDVREKSQKMLIEKGPRIRTLLDGCDDGGSAERRKRLREVMEQIDTAIDESEEDSESQVRPLIRGDEIVTPDFSIVGKIVDKNFEVKTRFGQLVVQLQDIRMADRSFGTTKAEVKKSVRVGAMKFFQQEVVSSRIRINRGDRIRIKADGVVAWTNWNKSSTPEGLTNQGNYQGMNSGTLCAKIGKDGELIKIGTSADFVAKSSGVLYLGVAMKDSYVDSSGYKWTGDYNVKIRVTVGK